MEPFRRSQVREEEGQRTMNIVRLILMGLVGMRLAAGGVATLGFLAPIDTEADEPDE